MYLYHYFIAEVIPQWYASQGVTMALPFRTAVFISIFWSWFTAMFIYFRTHHAGPIGLLFALAPAVLFAPLWISLPALVALGVPGGWIMITIVILVSFAMYCFDDISDDDMPKFNKYSMLTLLYGGIVLLITTWFIF